MVAPPRTIALTVYAPALGAGDERPLAIVHGMERVLSGLRLAWTMSEEEELVALPHRDAWVAATSPDGGLPFLCNDDKRRPVTVAGWENPNGLAVESPPRFEVHADLPLDADGIASAADVLEAIGESARAIWGKASPDGYGAVVAQQFFRHGGEPHVPPHGLPSLRRPRDNRAPEIPHYLAWMNYWSAATASALGFPNPAHDAELLEHARRTATGGWVVQLTEAPLDLDNPAHLEALLRAYERFPVIGGRAALR